MNLYYISKYNVSDFDEDDYIKESASSVMMDDYESELLDKNSEDGVFANYGTAVRIAKDMIIGSDCNYRYFVDDGNGGNWEVTI